VASRIGAAKVIIYDRTSKYLLKKFDCLKIKPSLHQKIIKFQAFQ
jgi:hypothetical protein